MAIDDNDEEKKHANPFIVTNENLVIRSKNQNLVSSSCLRDVVSKQLEELTVDLGDGWEAKEELPQPEQDFSTYRDAFASAVKKCTHTNYEEILYRKEYICLDCNKYVAYRDLAKKGFWDILGG